MKIFDSVKYIFGHPLTRHHKLATAVRVLKWQINTRLNPYPVIYPFTEHSKLIVQRGMTGATGNIYCGLHEYSDMSFLLHLLRKGDCFLDIGANVGSYTILASGQVGANTIAFEPVPETFKRLADNISINQLEKIAIAYNIALGSSKGSIGFNTSSLDTMHHVADKNEAVSINVPVETLDEIMVGKQSPLLIKIDVEGFETEVINGAGQTLQNEELKAIIIELNGSGSRYGYNEEEIHNTLLGLKFKPFHYDPKKRSLSQANSFGDYNTIYIRDLDFVQQRLKSAPLVKILNSKF